MRGAPPLMLFRVMAGQPRAWEKFRAGSLLDRGPLSLREREIVIDRTCALNKCEYEWGVHVAIFAKRCAVSPTRRSAPPCMGGADAPCWSAAEQAHDRGGRRAASPRDAQRCRIRGAVGALRRAKIFEIILLCGFYRTVSYLANGLEAAAGGECGAVSGVDKRLRHARPQQIVQMNDPDRLAGVGDDQRGDLRRIEQLQRFAGERVAGDGLRIAAS